MSLLPALALGNFVEIGVEARQYDRPGWRVVASSFAVAGTEPVEPAAITGSRLPARFHLGFDEKVASPGRIDRTDFRKTLRPIAARDLQEVE